MAKKKKLPLENAVKVFMLVLCITGFFYVVWAQWQNYIDKATSTKVDYIKEDKLPFPYIVFCPKKKLKDGSQYDGFRPLEDLNPM